MFLTSLKEYATIHRSHDIKKQRCSCKLNMGSDRLLDAVNWMAHQYHYGLFLIAGGYNNKFVNKLAGLQLNVRFFWKRRYLKLYRSVFGYLNPVEVQAELSQNPAWRPTQTKLEYAEAQQAGAEAFRNYTVVL